MENGTESVLNNTKNIGNYWKSLFRKTYYSISVGPKFFQWLSEKWTRMLHMHKGRRWRPVFVCEACGPCFILLRKSAPSVSVRKLKQGLRIVRRFAWRPSGTALTLRVRPYDSLLQIKTVRVFKELFYRDGHNTVLVTFQKHFVTGYNDFLERVTNGTERA